MKTIVKLILGAAIVTGTFGLNSPAMAGGSYSVPCNVAFASAFPATVLRAQKLGQLVLVQVTGTYCGIIKYTCKERGRTVVKCFTVNCGTVYGPFTDGGSSS